MATEKLTSAAAAGWLEEDNLMLLECWSRDGYTYADIANRMGVSVTALARWRQQNPEIENALRAGREIIDYKVENALLKAALGYQTREVKVTTTMRYGKVVETIKEVTDKEQAPNVSAIQCWLYNRLPKKWKNMNSRANILDDIDEDTSVQVIVTRASKDSPSSNKTETSKSEDEEWQDEVNQSISIRGMSEKEKEEAKQNKAKAKAESNKKTETEIETEEEDLDYWPDDWDEDSEWED